MRMQLGLGSLIMMPFQTMYEEKVYDAGRKVDGEISGGDGVPGGEP